MAFADRVEGFWKPSKLAAMICEESLVAVGMKMRRSFFLFILVQSEDEYGLGKVVC